MMTGYTTGDPPLGYPYGYSGYSPGNYYPYYVPCPYCNRCPHCGRIKPQYNTWGQLTGGSCGGQIQTTNLSNDGQSNCCS